MVPFKFIALFMTTFLVSPLLAQNSKPSREAVAEVEPVQAENLVPYTEVSKAEMDAWPVDKRQTGEPRWGESTFGMGKDGPHTNLFNYNIWPNRAVLRVQDNSSAVTADVPWRRSKLFIRLKGLKLIDGKTGAEIRDAELVQYNQERAVVRFSPASGPGLYYLYYGVDEPAPRFTPSKEFQKSTAESRAIAHVERIEARSPLDNFWPMEVAATKAETDNLLAKYPDAPYLVFPEDRERPITPLKLDESRREITSWGHTLKLDSMGLPVNVSYRAEEILAEPFNLSGLVDGRAIQWSAPSLAFTETAEDHVSWRGKATARTLMLQIDGRIEFDGIIVLDLKLTSADPQKVNDLLLQGTWRGENAQLASGIGYTTTFTHPKNGVLVVVASWHSPVEAWLKTKLDVSLLLDRATLGLHTGSLQTIDILTGETVDLTKPIEINKKISNRLIWLRNQ